MRFFYLVLAMGLLVGVFALVGILTTGADMLRRRRERHDDADASVIADSQIEFESDVGKHPPEP